MESRNENMLISIGAGFVTQNSWDDGQVVKECKEVSKKRKREPMSLPQLVRSLPEDGSVNGITLAEVYTKLMDPEVSMNHKIGSIVMFMFGTRSMLNFFTMVWLTQLKHFPDHYSIKGRYDAMLYALPTLKWNPVFHVGEGMIMFYPFGIKDAGTGYFVTNSLMVSGVMAGCIHSLFVNSRPIHIDHQSSRAYFGLHKDIYMEKFGEEAFGHLRNGLIFWFVIKSIILLKNAGDQLAFIKYVVKFYQKWHPDSGVAELFANAHACMKARRKFNYTETLETLLRSSIEKIMGRL